MKQETDQKTNDDADVFTSVEQSFDEVHSNIERLTPVYAQSLSNFQQEFLTMWKNLMCSGISTQRKYAENIGLDTTSNDLLTQIVQKITKETSEVFELHSNFTQTFLETSIQNIKRFNENGNMYAEWNKKLLDSYMNFSRKIQ